MAVDKYDIDYKHSLEECIANFPIYSRLVFKEKTSWRLKGVHDVDTEIRKILIKTFEPSRIILLIFIIRSVPSSICLMTLSFFIKFLS